jgi:hypothetical protein
MSPTAYEALCAKELRQNGWDARLTPTTGDQGVDIVAEKSGVRVVIQCKLYSASVGNTAVQEIVAAKAFERASYAVVVSNSPYTSAAQQLARVNDVFLLHHNDLSRLHTLLDFKTGAGTASAQPAQSQNEMKAHSVIREVAVPEIPPPTETPEEAEPLPDLVPNERSVQEYPSKSVLARVVAFRSQLPDAAKTIFILLVALIIVYASAKLNISWGRRSQEGYQTYSNTRFGYWINYPSSFTASTDSSSADGITVGDGTATLIISGVNNKNGGSTKNYYDIAVSGALGLVGYKRLEGTWFVVTYDSGNTLTYEKVFVGSGSLNAFVMTFPKIQRSKYEPIVTKIEKSFHHGDVNHRH